MNQETKKKLKFIFLTSSIGLMILLVGVILALGIYDSDNCTEGIVTNNTKVGNIPVLEIYKDDHVNNKSMIILQHGFKNKKEAMTNLGKALAEEGFFVIAPDAYAHGERDDSPLSLVEIIVETAKEYDDIIKNYENDERVDLEHIGMSGFSMGGCICFYYAVNGQYTPEVMAPTITTPYFEQLIGTNLGKSIYNKEEGVKIEQDDEKIATINQFIINSSPFSDYVDLVGIDMLIQNGAADTYVTSEGVDKLKEALEKVENTDCVVEFISVPDVKHKVNSDMKENIVLFMTQNLAR